MQQISVPNESAPSCTGMRPSHPIVVIVVIDLPRAAQGTGTGTPGRRWGVGFGAGRTSTRAATGCPHTPHPTVSLSPKSGDAPVERVDVLAHVGVHLVEAVDLDPGALQAGGDVAPPHEAVRVLERVGVCGCTRARVHSALIFAAPIGILRINENAGGIIAEGPRLSRPARYGDRMPMHEGSHEILFVLFSEVCRGALNREGGESPASLRRNSKCCV